MFSSVRRGTRPQRRAGPQAQRHRRKRWQWRRRWRYGSWTRSARTYLADGRECRLLSGIDDHFRFMVGATVLAVQSGKRVDGTRRLNLVGIRARNPYSNRLHGTAYGASVITVRGCPQMHPRSCLDEECSKCPSLFKRQILIPDKGTLLYYWFYVLPVRREN
jgi:hypothetical protein